MTCRLGTLAVGVAWRIHIRVTIKASTGTIRDKASITGDTPDPRTGNDGTAPHAALCRSLTEVCSGPKVEALRISWHRLAFPRWAVITYARKCGTALC